MVVCMAQAGDDTGVTLWHQPKQGRRADLGIPSSFIQEPKSAGRAKVKLAHLPAGSPCSWGGSLALQG